MNKKNGEFTNIATFQQTIQYHRDQDKKVKCPCIDKSFYFIVNKLKRANFKTNNYAEHDKNMLLHNKSIQMNHTHNSQKAYIKCVFFYAKESNSVSTKCSLSIKI